MIENLKRLLSSSDESLIKQGIELLLTLDMEEEIDREFKDALDGSDLSTLRAGDRFKALFQDPQHTPEEEDDDWEERYYGDEKDLFEKRRAWLIQVALLVLLKLLNEKKKFTSFLCLDPNPYFEEFSLLSEHFKGIDHVELIGVEWTEIKQLIEANPQIRSLKVTSYGSINWSEAVTTLSGLESLSLGRINLVDFFKEKDCERLRLPLERGINPLIPRNEKNACQALESWKIRLKTKTALWMPILSRQTGLMIKRKVKRAYFNLIYAPPGEFYMGSEDEESIYNEKPRHKVTITKGMWMAQTLTTQALWRAVMGKNPSSFKGGTLPVEQVKWLDAVKFCNKLSMIEGFDPAYSIGEGDQPKVIWNRSANGYRLPSEFEWEYCAKAGTELRYAGSNDHDKIGWHHLNNGGRFTRPVGMLMANSWGFVDFSGNCSEWTNSSWESDTYEHRKGGTIDPYTYSDTLGKRWIRSGFSNSLEQRIVSHYKTEHTFSSSSVSFRIMRPDL